MKLTPNEHKATPKARKRVYRQVGLRLTPSEYALLEKIAKADERPLAFHARKLVLQGLAAIQNESVEA